MKAKARALGARANVSRLVSEAIGSNRYSDPRVFEEIMKVNPELRNLLNLATRHAEINTTSPVYKLGGVLKAQKGTTLYGGNKVDLSIKPKKEGNLFYGNADISGNDWRFKKGGGYTDTYLNTVNNLDNNWFEQNKDRIQGAVTKSGSKFILKDLAQLKTLATDNKPGVLHDIINMSLPKPIAPSVVASQPAATPSVTVKPVEVNTKEGVLPALGKSITGGIKGIGEANLANVLGYTKTVGAISKAANEQRAAYNAGAYQLPFIGHKYTRVTSDLPIIGNKLSNDVRSKFGRVAKSTSDFDKSVGTLLSGESKATEIGAKYNLAGNEELAKKRLAQETSDMRVDLANTETVGKNRAIAATTAKQIGLVNANEATSKNAAFNNFLLAYYRNKEAQDIKSTNKGYMDLMYKLSNDPNLVNLQKQYTDLSSDEEYAKRKSAYDQMVKNSGAEMPEFEESQAYKNYANQIKGLEKKITPLTERIQRVQMAQYYQQPVPFAKSGGSLSKSDRIEIEAFKDENKRRLKDAEMTLKSIMHNNEMLQKALLKIK